MAATEGDAISENAGTLRQALRVLAGGESPQDAQVRHAAWVARCVGRGSAAPLLREDVAALAGTLDSRQFDSGAVVFAAGEQSTGVWIVRQGLIELAVGSGRRRLLPNVFQRVRTDWWRCWAGRCLLRWRNC